MTWLIRIIRTFDFFSVQPTWYVRGNLSTTSSSGIFSSILMTIFIIWSLIYLSSNLVQRKNVNVTSSSLLGIALEDAYYINQGKFSYVFGVQNGETGEFYYNEALFQVSAKLCDNYGDVYPIKMSKCSPDAISKNFPYTGDLVCFDSSQDNITISGLNSLLTLAFSICNETTSEKSCATDEEVQRIYTRKDQFYVFFPIDSIIPWDFDEPVLQYWNYQNFFVDSRATKRLSLVLKKLSITTDQGWISEDLVSDNKTVHSDWVIDNGFRMPDEFFSVEIFTNGDVEFISRSYPKIQDLLAQISGTVNACFFILAVLVIPFTRMKMYQYLGLDVFTLSMEKTSSFKPEKPTKVKKKSLTAIFRERENGVIEEVPERESDENSIDREIEKNNESESDNQMNKSIMDSINQTNIVKLQDVLSSNNSFSQADQSISPTNIIKIDPTSPKLNGHTTSGYHKQPKSPEDLYAAGTRLGVKLCKKKPKKKNELDPIFRVSYFEWIASFFRATPKTQLAQKVKDEVSRRLDVSTVVRKFIEFELLKDMLLNDSQQILFDNLCRAKIKMEYVEKPNGTFDYKFKNDEFLNTLAGKKEFMVDAYNDIKKNPQKTRLDEMLLNRYEKRIKQMKRFKTTNVVESWIDV